MNYSKESLVREIKEFGVFDFLMTKKSENADPLYILSVLGCDPNNVPDGTDDSRWTFLRNYIKTRVLRRPKLDHVNTMEEVRQLLEKSNKILVLTGAGISVSCGIPDFRSDSGIYERLAREYQVTDPESLFDINFFREDPEPFYSFVKDIFPRSEVVPSPTHYFIRLLEMKQKLLRNYSQNVDTLEGCAGIEKVINCHGSFASASCLSCGNRVAKDAIREDVLSGIVPMCKRCKKGVMKPDIVFFGEPLPDLFQRALLADKDICDLVIVIGSSLKVHPVAGILDMIPPEIPQIYINKQSCSSHNFDIELLGPCDPVVYHLCQLVGWKRELGVLFGKEECDLEDFEIKHIPPHRYLYTGADVSEKTLRSFSFTKQ